MSLILLTAVVLAWVSICVTVVCLCAMASGSQRRARSLPRPGDRFSRGSSSGLRPTT